MTDTKEKPVTTPRRLSRKRSGPRITVSRRALTPRAES